MAENKQPKIRFKGFSEDWTEFELKEIVDVKSGRDYKHLSEGNIPVYGTGGYMLSVNEALSYDEDAIGIGRKGTIDKPYILKSPFWTVDTLFYAVPKEKNDLNFIYDIFQKINWKQKDESTGVPSLSKVVINAVSVFTTDDCEQSKIGEFFKNIDNLIVQKQNKYDKLINIKKSMLQKMFPKDGSTVPEIRFKGFDEDWKLHQLGELGSVVMNRRIFKGQTSEVGEVPFYKIGTFGNKADAFISRELFVAYKNKYPFPKKGDVLISVSGSIGKIVEYAGKEEYFQDSNIVWLKHDEKLENSFLKYFYSVVKWNGLEGSTIKRLYNKNILETQITIPQPTEQSKIGEFFKNLDTLISLHQQELEKLKNIKKSCLENMFI